MSKQLDFRGQIAPFGSDAPAVPQAVSGLGAPAVRSAEFPDAVSGFSMRNRFSEPVFRGMEVHVAAPQFEKHAAVHDAHKPSGWSDSANLQKERTFDKWSMASSPVQQKSSELAEGELHTEACPPFLEHTHAKSLLESPAATVAGIEKALSRMASTDFARGKDRSAKLKVIVWNIAYVAKIAINVFRDTKEGGLIVEFQRRRGDSYVFNRLYRDVLAACPDVFGTQPRVPRAPMSCPLDLPLEDDFALGEEGAQPLFEMALSPFSDVSADGARAFVAAVQNPQNRAFLAVHERTSSVIDHLLASADADRACCGMRLLADCTEAVQNEVLAKRICESLRFFDQGALEWHETHRQLARAFHSFESCAALLSAHLPASADSKWNSLQIGVQLGHICDADRSRLARVRGLVRGLSDSH